MNCANHPDRERVAFCQNCGKPLCSECTRTVGSAVFCEPCLAARLAAADTATSSTGTPYGYVNVPNYGGAVPMPAVPGAPNPVLAAVLGFIPGVGAMYNGQYAKGVVHLIVFAVLVSLSDANGVFGILVAGWEFYQAFEAYHTARARRDGAPLPNPFGLNDIGERFGFGKSWAAGPATPPVAPQPAQYTAPFAATPPYTTPPASWGAPADTYSYKYNYTVPPIPTVGEPFAAVDPGFQNPQQGVQSPQSRFPVGAIWLIGLGLLFFFGSSGLFRHFPIQRLIPFFLIAVGVWIFVQKMTKSGSSLTDDGSPAYRLRLFRALRGAIWVILVGVLFLLDSFDILSWGHSWPLFILVAGLLMLLERTAYAGAAPTPYSYAATGPAGGPVAGGPIVSDPATPAPASPFSPSSGTSIVPSTLHDEEGR